MSADDLELLQAWRGGDGRSGERLVARHFDAVCRFFRNKVGHSDEAPDLIQQTFLACCEGRDRIRGESTFRTYLFGVARNVLLEHFRRRRRASERFDPLTQTVADLGASLGSVVARKREEQLLLQALRALPLDLQIAFELYHLEGMTARELGEIHGLTEPGMYGRLRKARLLLDAEISRLTRNPELRESTLGGLADWARSLRDQLGDGEE